MSNTNKTIQGLRGMLAMMVVVYHCYTGLTTSGYLGGNKALNLDILGYIAVDLFFIVSGFLIIQSLIKSKNVKSFAKNRALRIYPVFLTIHILIFIAGPIINYEWLGEVGVTEYILNFFSNLLFLPGLLDLPIAQIVAWSLSYEMFFYVSAAAIYFSKRKISNKWARISVLFLLSLGTIYVVTLHPRMLFFVVGILIYIFRGYIGSFYSKTNKLVDNFLNVIILALIFATYSPTFIIPAVILSFLFFTSVIQERGIISKILSGRLFNYLGAISFSLYLWHTLVMFPIKRILFPLFQGQPTLVCVLFTVSAIMASVVVSHFSYKFIEVAFVSKIKRLKLKQNEAIDSRAKKAAI